MPAGRRLLWDIAVCVLTAARSASDLYTTGDAVCPTDAVPGSPCEHPASSSLERRVPRYPFPQPGAAESASQPRGHTGIGTAVLKCRSVLLLVVEMASMGKLPTRHRSGMALG